MLWAAKGMGEGKDMSQGDWSGLVCRWDVMNDRERLPGPGLLAVEQRGPALESESRDCPSLGTNRQIESGSPAHGG